MMDLILQLNDQLTEMEKELVKLIQLKHASVETTITTAIPQVTTIVPSTLVVSLAPTAPLATTLPAKTTCTLGIVSTTTTNKSSDEVRKLIKVMEDMSI